MNFVFKLKAVDYLNHFPPTGIGNVDTGRMPKVVIACKDHSNLIPNNPARHLVPLQLCTKRVDNFIYYRLIHVYRYLNICNMERLHYKYTRTQMRKHLLNRHINKQADLKISRQAAWLV